MRSARLSGPTPYGAGPFIYLVIHFARVRIIQRKPLTAETLRTKRHLKNHQVCSVPSVSLVRETNGW